MKLIDQRKEKKVVGLMEDDLGGKIVTEFAALRPKTYSYLMDDAKKDKREKGTKKCVLNEYISLMIIKIVY